MYRAHVEQQRPGCYLMLMGERERKKKTKWIELLFLKQHQYVSEAFVKWVGVTKSCFGRKEKNLLSTEIKCVLFPDRPIKGNVRLLELHSGGFQ